MTDYGNISVYQCRKCNTIIASNLSLNGDMASLSLNNTSVLVKSSKVYCTRCKAFVATKNEDCTYQLESTQVHSTCVGNVNQRIKLMEDQLREQNTKIDQLNSRIIELGVQAITNRLDLITHKFAIEHNNPGFSVAQFKKELNSLE